MKQGSLYRAGDIALEILTDPIYLKDGMVSYNVAFYNIASQRPFFMNIARCEFVRSVSENMVEVSRDILNPKETKLQAPIPLWMGEIYKSIKKKLILTIT
jgi:hypothetical protein